MGEEGILLSNPPHSFPRPEFFQPRKQLRHKTRTEIYLEKAKVPPSCKRSCSPNHHPLLL